MAYYSCQDLKVDPEGFDPSAFSMPLRRAPNCAMGPKSRQNCTRKHPIRQPTPHKGIWSTWRDSTSRLGMRSITKIFSYYCIAYHDGVKRIRNEAANANNKSHIDCF